MMDISKLACIAVYAGLLGAAPVQAAEPAQAKADVVAFNASVRVEVDAAGKPVKVEAPADLPESIRAYIEKRVASWQYQPAKVNGTPVSAVTFVQVGACAVPTEAGGAFKLGLDFKGNGPRIVAAADRLPPPSYPIEAQVKGYSGTFRVGYSIEPDGKPRLDSIETLDGGNKLAKVFHPALKKWVENLRYEPEQVDGRSVSTQMSYPVEFVLDTGHRHETVSEWRKRYLADLQARAIASKECVAAGGGDALRPIAQNSPIKVIPAPAG